mgnify:CR=1 FL=1
MRILLVHNFYGSSAPSGENRAVLEERDLLREAFKVVKQFRDFLRRHYNFAMF